MSKAAFLSAMVMIVIIVGATKPKDGLFRRAGLVAGHAKKMLIEGALSGALQASTR